MGGCTSAQKTHSTPITKEVPNITNKMYLKGGRIIECDMVWEGMASQILCKKSADIVAYSADDVDLVRTFGESSTTEIAERYKKRVEGSRRDRTKTIWIETPEEVRLRVGRERRRKRELEESTRAEKRELEGRGEWRKIKDLERNPKLYFENQMYEETRKDRMEELERKKLRVVEEQLEIEETRKDRMEELERKKLRVLEEQLKIMKE